MNEKNNHKIFILFETFLTKKGTNKVKGVKQMSHQNLDNQFEEIYQATYSRVLKYIVCKCTNLEDVNDLAQDTYVELYRHIQKGKIDIKNIEAYIVGIAHNKLKKYYGKKQEDKVISFPFKEEMAEEDDEWKAHIDLERDIVTKDNVAKVWEYLKNKNMLTAKIFYLYYVTDNKISDISKELEISESKVKNNLYRTLEELKNVFGKEGKENEI